jgi:hypothetical protein
MPCIGYGCGASQTGEGFASTDRNPSSVADFVRATFSHKGRREEMARLVVIAGLDPAIHPASRDSFEE